MILIYSILISFYRLAIAVVSLFSDKARLWIVGRKDWQKNMSAVLSGLEKKPIWVHVSSVGEYEQGKPIIDSIQAEYPQVPIVLTFFSPSGFQLLKGKTRADFVFYLPLDSKNNASVFLDIVNPVGAIFIKYEFWYFYFNELKNRNIPFTLISAKLRPDQFFFKWYGKPYQRILKLPNYYFVQDEETRRLLNKIGVTSVSVAGDTRIDRVSEILNENEVDQIVESHIGDKKVLILGSSWQDELDMLVSFLKNNPDSDWKFIVAPHEIQSNKIDSFEQKLSVLSLRYTLQFDNRVDEDVPVLIIDCIGKLKHLYKYGTVAFIGGGFGSSIHNILEPVAFGLPVLFGPNHQKFPEAQTLLDSGGAFVVNNQKEFDMKLNEFVENQEAIEQSSKACESFINENLGATNKIMSELKGLFHV